MTQPRRYVQPSPEMGGVTKFILFCAFLAGIGFGIGDRLDERHIATIIQYLGIAFVAGVVVFAVVYAVNLSRRQQSDQFYDAPRPRGRRAASNVIDVTPALPYHQQGAFPEAGRNEEIGSWVELPERSRSQHSGSEWG